MEVDGKGRTEAGPARRVPPPSLLAPVLHHDLGHLRDLPQTDIIISL